MRIFFISVAYFTLTKKIRCKTTFRIPHGKTNVDDGGPRPVVVLGKNFEIISLETFIVSFKDCLFSLSVLIALYFRIFPPSNILKSV